MLHVLVFILISFVHSVSGFSTMGSTRASTVEVRKPQVDKWQYRSFILANQIRCVIVSDPLADKAAAAVDVRFRPASNPSTKPFLALVVNRRTP